MWSVAGNNPAARQDRDFVTSCCVFFENKKCLLLAAQTRLLLTTGAGDGPGDPACPSVSWFLNTSPGKNTPASVIWRSFSQVERKTEQPCANARKIKEATPLSVPFPHLPSSSFLYLSHLPNGHDTVQCFLQSLIILLLWLNRTVTYGREREQANILNQSSTRWQVSHLYYMYLVSFHIIKMHFLKSATVSSGFNAIHLWYRCCAVKLNTCIDFIIQLHCWSECWPLG